MAWRAARSSGSPGAGCDATADFMPARAKVPGAIQRHVSQSMQLSSTNRFPGAFSSRRGEPTARARVRPPQRR